MKWLTVLCEGVPDNLCTAIFPWVEAELENLHQRQSANPNACDISATKFLEVLTYFRLVLLQDLALLHHQFPRSAIFTVPPFNSDAFHKFAEGAPALVQDSELRRRVERMCLVVHLAIDDPNRIALTSGGAMAWQEPRRGPDRGSTKSESQPGARLGRHGACAFVGPSRSRGSW